MNTQNITLWRVESIRDGQSKLIGYRVVRGIGWGREEADVFIGTFANFGSFQRAFKNAEALRDELNTALIDAECVRLAQVNAVSVEEVDRAFVAAKMEG